MVLKDMMQAIPQDIAILSGNAGQEVLENALQQRKEELNKWQSDSKQLLELFIEFKAQGIAVNFLASLDSVINDLSEKLEIFKDNPNSITNSLGWLNHANKGILDALPNSLNERLLSAWEKHVKTQIDSIGNKLAVFQSIPVPHEYAEEFNEIKIELAELKSQNDQLPNISEIESPKVQSRKIQELLDKLPEKLFNLDSEVEEFLAALESNSARVTHFTESVMKWIHDNGLGSQYSIIRTNVEE